MPTDTLLKSGRVGTQAQVNLTLDVILLSQAWHIPLSPSSAHRRYLLGAFGITVSTRKIYQKLWTSRTVENR